MNKFNEELRLLSLCGLGILDTPQEDRFDRFTTLAAAAFSVPISLVSLVDAERQWFKSHHGLHVRETHRSVAFCSHAIEGEPTFVVEDASVDPRFADNPLVTGAPNIRFYAGHPVRSLDGFAMGTVCIIDTIPRRFDEAGRDMLASLARMVEDELNRPLLVAARQRAEQSLRDLNGELERKVRKAPPLCRTRTTR